MKKILKSQLIIFVLLLPFTFLIGGQEVKAKSVSVSSNTSTYVLRMGVYNLINVQYMGYDISAFMQPMNSDLTPLSTTPPAGYPSMSSSAPDTEWYGLENAYGTVVYKAKLINNTTGDEISDGETVSTGTTIRVERDISTLNTDISWVGTGSLNDSPYGRWVAGAGPISRGCYASDFVGGWGNTYFLFNVNPPSTQVVSSSGNLSCAGNLCTVTSPGPVSVRLNFDSTFGRFYQRMEYSAGVCLATNIPLGASEYNGSLPFRTVFSLPIPSTNIIFNLSAVAGNNAPNAPTVTPQPFSGSVSTAYPWTAVATDPDNEQIYYQFDWNNDGTPDQNTPIVNSGTPQTLVNPVGQWNASGTYAFKVRTQDSSGGVSGWTTAQVAVEDPVYSCINAIPTNSSLCTNDDVGLVANTARTVVNSCTVTKCEYTCNSGYLNSGGVCIPTQCNDGVDNADPEDTLVDLADPGCANINDNDESNPVPTSSLTVPGSCVIPVGGTGCNFTIDWSSSYVTSPNVRKDGVIISFSPNENGFSQSNLAPGTYTYSFNDGASVRDTGSITVLCDGSTSWDGSRCDLVAVTQPDLTPSLPIVSAGSVAQGGVITFNTNNITNTGTDVAGPYSIGGFYIDYNNDGVSDYTEQVSSVSTNTVVGGIETKSVSWNVPLTAPVGTYRVSYIVDVANVINESDEGNNFSGWSAPFTVTAPLSCSSGVVLPWTVGPNSCSAITTSNKNSGETLTVSDSTPDPAIGIASFTCRADGTWDPIPNPAHCSVPPPSLPPSIIITADPSIIRSGSTATIKVVINSNHEVGCRLANADVTTINFTHYGTDTNPSGTYTNNTRVLTSTQMVTAICEDRDTGLVTNEEVRIEVVPVVQEI